jgi:hypothetical protein
MARMPGRYARPFCPDHPNRHGRDCPDISPSLRQVRRRLADELRDELDEAVADRAGATMAGWDSGSGGLRGG